MQAIVFGLPCSLILVVWWWFCRFDGGFVVFLGRLFCSKQQGLGSKSVKSSPGTRIIIFLVGGSSLTKTSTSNSYWEGKHPNKSTCAMCIYHIYNMLVLILPVMSQVIKCTLDLVPAQRVRSSRSDLWHHFGKVVPKFHISNEYIIYMYIYMYSFYLL